ncbi:MAG: sugar ABC transporter ATP-binding protein [Oscillospiraceae bacterium]|nr:sugar ABC transporter ATP-binding protein [Oscillospiraceae bacterium]
MTHSLEFKGIGKLYPGVKALDDINFRAEGGKVLALMGENGAGKSTLLKILAGDIRPTEGTYYLDEKERVFDNPHDAILAGVSVIYQERQMMPALSVAENIYAGFLPKTKAGLIDRKTLYANAQKIIDKFGLPIKPRTPVARLSVAYQQMVEIMKAYSRNPTVIAFDEPTASLSDAEIAALFRIIAELKAEGKIILYVSHRMAEIFQLADDIVVFKDGKFVTQMKAAEADENKLVRAMVGREIGDTYANLKRNDTYGDVLLEVKNLNNKRIHDVSFTLRKGEVLGLAGLVGAGRTELVRAIFGADKVESGEIIFDGQPGCFKSPYDAIKAGIALCPEDRKEQGLVLFRSIRENTTIPVLGSMKKGLFLNKKLEKEITQEAIEKYSIRTDTMEKLATQLSGGNQQKVILGRWTNRLMETKLLILDEPTKGIDVGTKAEIYQMVCDIAKQGIGVIFISSETPEVIGVADNILVMHNGKITGKLKREEANEENILALAMD